MFNRALLTFLSTAVIFLSGCQKGGNDVPASGGSTVTIAAISPGIEKALTVGDRVKISVDVSYTLNAESGTVTLVVQSADNANLANHVEVITKGSGHVTLQTEFVVPATSAIQVFTPISVQGQNATYTVDSRTFKVGT